MREFLILLIHLLVTTVRLAKPGGLRTVLAESVLCRHQLLILNRGRERAPNLRPSDSNPRRSVHTSYPPRAPLSFCDRSETFHPAASPPGPGEAKVSLAVFAQARPAWRTQATDQRT